MISYGSIEYELKREKGLSSFARQPFLVDERLSYYLNCKM